MRTLLLTLICLFFLFACNRHVSKNLDKGRATYNEQTTKSDSSQEKNTLTVEHEKVYGDSLQGSLSFNTNTSDSIESNGIKVKGTLIPLKDGFKVRISAIAKPVKEKRKTTFESEYQKGLAERKTIDTDSTWTTIKKEKVSKEPISISLIMFLLLALLIVILLIYFRFLRPP